MVARKRVEEAVAKTKDPVEVPLTLLIDARDEDAAVRFVVEAVVAERSVVVAEEAKRLVDVA